MFDIVKSLGPWREWSEEDCRSTYVMSTKGQLRFHRLVLPVDAEKQIDHKNNNSLDNRKDNLREVTNMQNCWNQRISSDNTSGFKGVIYDKHIKGNRKWRAQIGHDYKVHFLGRFSTPEQAALAYNKAATRFFGEYAHLNKTN